MQEPLRQRQASVCCRYTEHGTPAGRCWTPWTPWTPTTLAWPGRILRHIKIAVTMEIYPHISSELTRNALHKLGDSLAGLT